VVCSNNLYAEIMKDKYNDMVDNITSHMLTVMFWGFSGFFFFLIIELVMRMLGKNLANFH